MPENQKHSNNSLLAVIDTNVIISSLWGGIPGKIIDLWEKELFKIAVSNKILNEYIDVLTRFRITDEDLDEFILLFTDRKNVIIAKPKNHINAITDDPEDNKFLECAYTSNADYIISGDKHLLKLKEYKGIQVITPAKFIKLI